MGLPLVGFWVGEASPDWRSVVCSAAMSSSRSLLYSGEGDASSASGVVIISLYAAQALRASTDCCRELVEALGTARSALRAAVSSLVAVFPAKRFSQCVLGARVEAFQLCVLECDHACAGCLNGRCSGTLTAPMASNAGDPGSEGRSIRRTGMGQCSCGTEPGSVQSREHSRSTQNHG